MKKHLLLLLIILSVVIKGCCCIAVPLAHKQLYTEESSTVDEIVILSTTPLYGKTEGKQGWETVDEGNEECLH